MAQAARCNKDAVQPQSFLDCLNYFLTPHFWKQVHCAFDPCRALRWRPGPLLLTLLMMTWCAGDSQEERFETAKAFFIATHQRQRRPGKTLEGFSKALALVPARALRAVAALVRERLQKVFANRLMVDGFVPMGCDGSRLECPRTPQLQQRLLAKPKPPKRKRKDIEAKPSAAAKCRPPSLPMVSVTAFVHLATGLLWSWRLGGAHSSEREHLLGLLDTLPPAALIVADAGYVGYDLMQGLLQARRSFLIRLSSQAPLYTTERVALKRFHEGVVYYWPGDVQKEKKPPIPVRLICLRVERKIKLWLMTDVLDANRLSLSTASKFYRWRWRNEVFFRSYKRTLGKVRLMSRTVAQVHREAEGSLLAVQLILAQGVLALPLARADEAGNEVASVRQVLLEMRAEITYATGMYLGPRQRGSYLARLRQARLKHVRRKRRGRRKNQVRQRWPKRDDHRPPKAPKIRKMGTDLKDLLAQTLGLEGVAAC
jgi:hypothetical protein